MPISERNFNPQENSSYNVVSTIRACYGKEIMNLSKKRDGRGFNSISKIFNNYDNFAIKPDLKQISLDAELYSELVEGVVHFLAHRLVADKLSALSDYLLKDGSSEPLVVTDGMPDYVLKLRDIFPDNDDKNVHNACVRGLFHGWVTMLDLVDTDEIPLLLYSRDLKDDLMTITQDSTGDIILPTTIPGVKAKYDYSDEFSLPYITLQIDKYNQ